MRFFSFWWLNGRSKTMDPLKGSRNFTGLAVLFFQNTFFEVSTSIFSKPEMSSPQREKRQEFRVLIKYRIYLSPRLKPLSAFGRPDLNFPNLECLKLESQILKI